jgi:ABC-type transport system involved in multi-copper enzyme maturation permease subunit
MQRLLAIALLTVRAAFRYRLVVVLATLLVGGVVVLPIIIKDDGTARGFTQIVLTYTLALITFLLGFVTVWLGCGTLAKEVEEAQLQMVVVKPISRWQIWLGKWVGIMTLNAILLIVSGTAVYFLMTWKARRLPDSEQKVLWSEVLVARGTIREPMPDYKQDAERILQERLRSSAGQEVTNIAALRIYAQERVKAEYQLVRQDFMRQWEIDMSEQMANLRDVPMHIRVKFNVAMENTSNQYLALIEVGDPADGITRVWRAPEMMLSADTYHEIPIPANLFNAKGVLKVRFMNRNDTAVLFPLEDGMEVLYRQGGFFGNFIRGVGIIFCWLGFLAALGLMSASFLSFNVAAFFSLGVLMLGVSSGTLNQVVEEGGITGVNHETGYTDDPNIIDKVAVPVAKGMLAVMGMIKGFSPIDSLSTGRTIGWDDLGRAVFQIWVIMAGLLALIGITTFNRRELATAQGTS